MGITTMEAFSFPFPWLIFIIHKILQNCQGGKKIFSRVHICDLKNKDKLEV